MKKLLLAVAVAGLVSVSAMATEGTISRVIVSSNGEVKVVLEKTDGGSITKLIGGTVDAEKAMLALALTAKSTGDTVDGYNDGTTWTKIIIK